MKKYKVVWTVIGCILITISVIVVVLYAEYNNTQKERFNEIDTYLKERYNESFEIKHISIIDDAATCNLVSNPDVWFSVVYWVNEDGYFDTYLEKCLEVEAEELIQDKLQGKFDYECYINLVTGTLIERSTKLYEFYKSLGRPLSWQDDICNEKLTQIDLLIYDDNLSKDDAYSITELINTLPISYNRIIISKNTRENIILEVP